MIPVNQFILGSSDPLLYPSEKMTNSIDEQIAFLQSQKQAINEAYRRNAIPNANNGTTQNQQVPTQGIWDAIDAEIAPLTPNHYCKTVKGNYLRIVPFFYLSKF